MKGTDLTEEQIAAADNFLRTVGRFPAHISKDRKVVSTWGSLVRAVALYGAIRAEAVAHGATAKRPGAVHLLFPKQGEQR